MYVFLEIQNGFLYTSCWSENMFIPLEPGRFLIFVSEFLLGPGEVLSLLNVIVRLLLSKCTIAPMHSLSDTQWWVGSRRDLVRCLFIWSLCLTSGGLPFGLLLLGSPKCLAPKSLWFQQYPYPWTFLFCVPSKGSLLRKSSSHDLFPGRTSVPPHIGVENVSIRVTSPLHQLMQEEDSTSWSS